MEISKPYKFYYYLIIGIIVYYFFINRFCFYTVKNNKNTLYSFYLEDFSLRLKSSAMKKKFLLDCVYKDIYAPCYSKELLRGLVVVDLEGKISGYKSTFNEHTVVNISPFKSSLNKKFLQSTLFGSIKLIRL